MQHEIAGASDEAARLYYEKTLPEKQSSEGLHAAMTVAKEDKFNKLKSLFDKQVNVADPANGPEFLEEVRLFCNAVCLFYNIYIFRFCNLLYSQFVVWQINKHYSSNLKPEMTLERLQLVATAKVQPIYRIRWLKMWNSSAGSRVALRFPVATSTDKEFEAWLHRACFWAEVCHISRKLNLIFIFILLLLELVI